MQPAATVQIDGEEARQFISGLADNIGLEKISAARIIRAAVAARTRSCFLQSWVIFSYTLRHIYFICTALLLANFLIHILLISRCLFVLGFWSSRQKVWSIKGTVKDLSNLSDFPSWRILCMYLGLSYHILEVSFICLHVILPDDYFHSIDTHLSIYLMFLWPLPYVLICLLLFLNV